MTSCIQNQTSIRLNFSQSTLERNSIIITFYVAEFALSHFIGDSGHLLKSHAANAGIDGQF